MKSLKLQLITRILVVFTLALIILFMISYHETNHEIEEVFDAELAQTARMISQLTLANIDSKGLDLEIDQTVQHTGHKYEKHVSYQVWHKNTLVLRSKSAPTTPLSTNSGYNDVKLDNKQWRVFALYPESSPYRIYTAEDNKARGELSWEIVVESLEVYLWSLPALAILIYITVSRGLVTLERLSDEVHQQNVQQLELLNIQQVPHEVLPLVNALNELLARLDAAMLRERRFTSDASHELRTPLSGIKLHAQLAMKATTESEREYALQQIITAVDKSSRIVEQLLVLSRLEPGNCESSGEAVDIANICRKIIDEISDSAIYQDAVIKLHQHSDNENNTVKADKELLHTVFRNIVDNAIHYSGQNARVDININKINDLVEVVITDNGPGVPASEITNLTERFYRATGQNIAGCGLGLAIVSEAVSRLGGNLSLQNRTNGHDGFQVTVQLPG